jgi:hypothetical protein
MIQKRRRWLLLFSHPKSYLGVFGIAALQGIALYKQQTMIFCCLFGAIVAYLALMIYAVTRE